MDRAQVVTSQRIPLTSRQLLRRSSRSHRRRQLNRKTPNHKGTLDLDEISFGRARCRQSIPRQRQCAIPCSQPPPRRAGRDQKSYSKQDICACDEQPSNYPSRAYSDRNGAHQGIQGRHNSNRRHPRQFSRTSLTNYAETTFVAVHPIPKCTWVSNPGHARIRKSYRPCATGRSATMAFERHISTPPTQYLLPSSRLNSANIYRRLSTHETRVVSIERCIS